MKSRQVPVHPHALIFLLLFCGCVDARAETTLISDDFSAKELSAKLPAWLLFTDAGNAIAVVDGPGGRALRFTHESGAPWKPMLAGQVKPAPDKAMRVSFDFLLTRRFATDAKAFQFGMRGPGDAPFLRVAIGGPGAVVAELSNSSLVLGIPLSTNVWHSISFRIDPLSRGTEGMYAIAFGPVGRARVYEHIPFGIPKSYAAGKKPFPNSCEQSPTFSLPEAPGAQVFIDHVRVLTLD